MESIESASAGSINRAILEGQRPSVVLRECIRLNPSLRKRDMGALLLKEFPSVDTEVIQLFWNWRDVDEIRPGFPDEVLDENVRRLLTKAGYQLSYPHDR